MKLLLTILALSITALPAYAAEETHDEEQVKHYAPEAIRSNKDALAKLDKGLAEIEKLLADEKLADANFEAIHRNTYTFEAAVDKLRKDDKAIGEDAVDALDEAVQALHYASENHKEAETREWFTKLKTANKGVQHAS